MSSGSCPAGVNIREILILILFKFNLNFHDQEEFIS